MEEVEGKKGASSFRIRSVDVEVKGFEDQVRPRTRSNLQPLDARMDRSDVDANYFKIVDVGVV